MNAKTPLLLALLLGLGLASTIPAARAQDAAPAAAATAGDRVEVPIEHFFRDAEFTSAALSPDGRHIAITVPQGDRTILTILKIDGREVVSKFDYGEERHIADVAWTSNERVIFRVQRKLGRFDFQTGSADLYATNIDGSRRIDIPNGNFFQIVDMTPEDDDTILVSRSLDTAFLFRLNVKTGRTVTVATAPLEQGGFLVDHERNVRYAIGMKDAETQQVLERVGESWRVIHESDANDGETITPVGFHPDNRRAYFRVSSDGRPPRLVLMDPATREMEELSSNPNVEPDGGLRSSDGRAILAVRYEDGIPSYDFIDDAHPQTPLFKGLVVAFPDHVVQILSSSADGSKVLLRAYSDVDPGQVYLYDASNGSATFLFANMDWIVPEQMSPMNPVQVTARDGTVLHGYLTLPAGTDGRNLPLIINPHGGPHGPRDSWGFNPEVQLLANRGYAVLQMNYRGSGGYGAAFLRAGYRQWGLSMQDDLTDSVNWAIAQGYADPSRVCIYGASYGGYAALMSVVREPTLYQCTVGYVGVYSMPMMKERGDIPQSEYGRRYLDRVLPATTAELQSQSPAYNVERIQVPIMLVHGAMDQRVPIAQMEFLIDQLEAAGKAPEDVVVEDREGHGFRDTQNNVDLYTRMLAFFDRHIGAGRQAAAPAPAAGR